MVKPNWMPALRVTITANAMLGRIAAARDRLKAYERIDPDVTIRKICGHYPFQREKDKQRLIEALRRAGVRQANCRLGSCTLEVACRVHPASLLLK
jgi:hypothetical protein